MSSIRPLQVTPLPLSSGAVPNQTQKEMEKTNTTLTMLLAQSTADSTFDPPPPPTATPSRIQETFQSYGDGSDPAYWVLAIAVVLMMYGLSK